MKFGGDVYGEGNDAYSITSAGDRGRPASVRRVPFAELTADASNAISRLDTLGPYREAFDPRVSYRSIDTLAQDAGSGEGKRLYPALYGDMLNEGPGVRNVIESLTPANRVRHLQNRSNALMRDPERASKQLMVYPPVLEPTGLNPNDFMRLAPEEQLGLMQKLGTLNTLHALEANLKRVQGTSSEGPLSYIPEELGSFTPVEMFEPMAKALRTSRGQGGLSTMNQTRDPLLYGANSLRKAGIVIDLLEGKPLNSRGARGIEFKKGGALTQACGCSSR